MSWMKADELTYEKEKQVIGARQQTNLNNSEQKILVLQSKVFFLISLNNTNHL